MSHFTQDFIDFFKDLAGNNNRDWFNANKKRYEQSVKDPFNEFIQHMLDEMGKRDKRYKEMKAKDCVFRIYRDVRFSKNKDPYKLQMGAIVSPGGRKAMHGEPGMYLEFTPEHVRIYSGMYMPEKDTLQRTREYMMANYGALEKALAGKDFKKNFGEIRGEKNKRLPSKEMMAAAADKPLLFNKQYYFFAELKPEEMLKKGFPAKLFKIYDTSEEVRDYLTKASGK